MKKNPFLECSLNHGEKRLKKEGKNGVERGRGNTEEISGKDYPLWLIGRVGKGGQEMETTGGKIKSSF